MQNETNPQNDRETKPNGSGVRRIKLNLTTVNEPGEPTNRTDRQLPPLTSNTNRPNGRIIARDLSNRSHSKPAQHAPAGIRRLSGAGLSASGQLTLSDQRKLGARIYHLKSYTTVGKINRKFSQDKRQRLLRNILALVMLIVILVIIFVVYNPVKDVVDLRKMLGIDSPFMSIPTETITEASVIPTFD